MPCHKNSLDHEILEILQNAESASESSDDFEESSDISMDSAIISNSSDADESPPSKKKMPLADRYFIRMCGV
jgi:hypothetical protein